MTYSKNSTWGKGALRSGVTSPWSVPASAQKYVTSTNSRIRHQHAAAATRRAKLQSASGSDVRSDHVPSTSWRTVSTTQSDNSTAPITLAARGLHRPGRSRAQVLITTQPIASAATHTQYGPVEIVASKTPIPDGSSRDVRGLEDLCDSFPRSRRARGPARHS